MNEFVDIKNNNDSSDVNVVDSSIFTSGVQTTQEYSDLVINSDNTDNGDSNDVGNVPIFSLDDNGNVLVLDNDVLTSLNTFSESTDISLSELRDSIVVLNDNVKILTGVVVVLGFAFLMRLIVHRVFGRWSV